MRGKNTKDRVCEECKEIRQEGKYLTLGFFFGFLCEKCIEDLITILYEPLPFPTGVDSTKDLFDIPPVKIAEVKAGIIDPEDFDKHIPVPHSYCITQLTDTSVSTQEAQGEGLGPGVTSEYFSGINDAIMVLEQRLVYLKGLQ